MMNMQDNVLVAVAIIAITIIEIVALIELHIDGVLMSGIVAAIAGLVVQKETKRRCIKDWANGRTNYTLLGRSRRSSSHCN